MSNDQTVRAASVSPTSSFSLPDRLTTLKTTQNHFLELLSSLPVPTTAADQPQRPSALLDAHIDSRKDEHQYGRDVQPASTESTTQNTNDDDDQSTDAEANRVPSDVDSQIACCWWKDDSFQTLTQSDDESDSQEADATSTLLNRPAVDGHQATQVTSAKATDVDISKPLPESRDVGSPSLGQKPPGEIPAPEPESGTSTELHPSQHRHASDLHSSKSDEPLDAELESRIQEWKQQQDRRLSQNKPVETAESSLPNVAKDKAEPDAAPTTPEQNETGETRRALRHRPAPNKDLHDASGPKIERDATTNPQVKTEPAASKVEGEATILKPSTPKEESLKGDHREAADDQVSQEQRTSDGDSVFAKARRSHRGEGRQDFDRRGNGQPRGENLSPVNPNAKENSALTDSAAVSRQSQIEGRGTTGETTTIHGASPAFSATTGTSAATSLSSLEIQAKSTSTGASTSTTTSPPAETGPTLAAVPADTHPLNRTTTAKSELPALRSAPRLPQQAINRITAALKDVPPGDSTIRLRLNPEALGNVEVEIAFRNGVMSARMRAEKGDTHQMLQESLDSLKQRLSEHGISVESLDVEWGNPSHSGSQSGGQQQASQMGQDGSRQGFFRNAQDGFSSRSRPPQEATEETDRSSRDQGGWAVNVVA